MEGHKLAVLIDSDNAQASISQELMAEIARYGVATVRRAYGDWTTPNLGSWKSVLQELAIQPVQQFRYTTGKNATDSALIIDAMDLLHTGDVEGFCIVSSDSDFTRLATRLRESGRVVYGFGERKTPKPFVAACDKFIYTDILKEEVDKPKAKAPATDNKLKSSLLNAIDSCVQDDGWAALGGVGSILLKSDPSFDSRNYGFGKLGDLVRAQKYLEVKVESRGGSGGAIYVKRKNK